MEIIKYILVEDPKETINDYCYCNENHLMTNTCVIDNNKYNLKFYIGLNDKNNNNEFAFVSDFNTKNKKNAETIENNAKEVIKLSFTDYNNDDLNKIKKDIINQFNNSGFFLYVIPEDYNTGKCVNIDNFNKTVIQEAIQKINNELVDLGLTIKLYKYVSSYSTINNINLNKLEYITLGEDKIAEVLVTDNYSPFKNNLGVLIEKLIEKWSIINLLEKKYNIPTSFTFSTNCDCMYLKKLGFHTDYETKENILKYYKCKNLLQQLVNII